MDPHLQCLTATNARGETSQEEADEYDGQHDRAITDMLKALLESLATLKTFEVNASTAQRLRFGRAAGADRPIVPARSIHRAGGA